MPPSENIAENTIANNSDSKILNKILESLIDQRLICEYILS
ncbi:hypothetical protein EV11_1086 [Prochlorococcus sp. SS52]|nr:hypothetical protein EV04_0029 [Prochlorococcus marinus str. LG]KGG22558.1 hypothetical protein EV08_0073 [Prochlorococcus marinus str. SS2]KGG24401.1 hypothetical protein EV09_0308 [Prochlorococcus marinus str. SS35]KGG34173.1 hypothetical protein EV10_0019 [Prochlorococcus marinus str. SS51]KGG35812.1 hypothetical protein EV11_1086 [Prochlorococcus sp. SS52]